LLCQDPRVDILLQNSLRITAFVDRVRD